MNTFDKKGMLQKSRAMIRKPGSSIVVVVVGFHPYIKAREHILCVHKSAYTESQTSGRADCEAMEEPQWPLILWFFAQFCCFWWAEPPIHSRRKKISVCKCNFVPSSSSCFSFFSEIHLSFNTYLLFSQCTVQAMKRKHRNIYRVW